MADQDSKPNITTMQWGQEHHKISFPPTADFTSDNPFEAPPHQITAVALSNDSTLLAVAAGGTISIYDVETMSIKGKLQTGIGHVHVMEFGEVPKDDGLDELSLIADSSKDASFRGEHSIEAWNLEDLTATLDDEGGNDIKVDALQPQTSITGTLTTFGGSGFHPDGHSFLYLSRNDVGRVRKSKISLFDLRTSRVAYTLTDHEDNIMCACFSPSGEKVATTSWDQTTKIYDAKSGSLIRSYGPTGRQNWACAFSPNEKYLAVSTGGSKVFVYSTADDGIVMEHDVVGHWARSLAWKPSSSGATMQLAVGAMAGGELADGTYVPARLSLFHFDDGKLVQDDVGPENSELYVLDTKERMVEVNDIQWLEQDSIVWRTSDGFIRIYDESSESHRAFGPGQSDAGLQHGQWFRRLVVASNFRSNDPLSPLRGWVGSLCPDGAFRIWNI